MESKTDILKSCLAEFRNMPDANVLMRYLSRENRFSFDDRLSISHSIEKAFSPMFLDMKAESPSLSESDLIYCALVAAGLSPVVIADCISISKDSLRMRKIRVKEKLSQSWVELLFPESDPNTATKSATEKCDDNVAQHNSQAQKHAILLPQNQLNEKVMETKNVTFGQAIRLGFKNLFKFSGRASRSEFWYFILFYAIILTAIPFLIRILYMLSMIIYY
ncbi:MAG: DUF805 domain-containing protein [Bacteroidaceae bacterium]|nr:DUF805 domain-containing protein [Bacteroidaceae bacterium]